MVAEVLTLMRVSVILCVPAKMLRDANVTKFNVNVKLVVLVIRFVLVRMLKRVHAMK